MATALTSNSAARKAPIDLQYGAEQPYPWEVSGPREQGVAPRILNKAFRRGGKLPYLRALVVVKNGHLIGERYYRGTEATDANTVMSVSKSFLSALAGLAIRQGHISLNQRVMDFFPEYSALLEDPRKDAITIRHLLKMTSGLPFDDHAEHWDRWMSSTDWVGFCLRLPLAADPGTMWNYSTCSTHILSALLTRAMGTATYDFARAALFDPLGITIGGWRQDPQSYFRGGWDMYFTPRDMTRFGYLFMRKGKLDGKRILPKSWIRESTRPYVSGWTWAELELIIVAAADANRDWDEASMQVAAIRDLITQALLEPLTR